jgi:hypothetical protein
MRGILRLKKNKTKKDDEYCNYLQIIITTRRRKTSAEESKNEKKSNKKRKKKQTKECVVIGMFIIPNFIKKILNIILTTKAV